MSDHEDDALAALYREGASDEPPAELDRRILAAAAAAAARRRRPWLLRPLPAAGLASAAVLLLAVALLLDPLTRPAIESPAAPPAPAEQAPAAARRAAARSGTPDDTAAADTEHRIEEIVVTGQRAELSSDLAQERTAPLSGLLLAPAAAPASYVATDCPVPFAVPPGAVLRSVEGGLEVTTEDEVFRVRCIDGTWVRENVHSNR